MKTILLKSGKVIKQYVEISTGPAFVGDPTAFVRHEGRIVWVVPGLSVDFTEAIPQPTN